MENINPLESFETEQIINNVNNQSPFVDEVKEKNRITSAMPRLSTDYIVENINYESLYNDLNDQLSSMNPDMILDAYKNASLQTGQYPQFAALKLKAPALFEQLMSERTRSFTPEEIKAIQNPVLRSAKGIAESFSAGWERQKFNRTFYTHLLFHGTNDKNFKIPFETELKLDYLKNRMGSFTYDGQSFLEKGLFSLSDMTSQFAVPMATQLASIALSPITGGTSLAIGGFLSSAMVYGNTFLQEGGSVAYDLMYNSDKKIPLDVVYSASVSAGTINAALETAISWGLLKGAGALMPKPKTSLIGKISESLGIKKADESLGTSVVEGMKLFKNNFVKKLVSTGGGRTAIKELVDVTSFYGLEMTEELSQNLVSSYMKSTSEIWDEPNFKQSFIEALDETIDSVPELAESLSLLYLLPLSSRGTMSILDASKGRILKNIYDKTIKDQKDQINLLTKEGLSNEEINIKIANNLKEKRENVYLNINTFENSDDVTKQSLSSKIIDLDSRINFYKDLGSEFIPIEKEEFSKVLVEEQTQSSSDVKNNNSQSIVESMFSYSNDYYSATLNSKNNDGEKGLPKNIIKLYEEAQSLKKDYDIFKNRIEKAREEIKNKIKFKELPFSKSLDKNKMYIKPIEDMMSLFYVLAEENGKLDKLTNLEIVFIDSKEAVDEKGKTSGSKGVFSIYGKGESKKLRITINKSVFASERPSAYTGVNTSTYNYIDTIFHELSHYIFEEEISPILEDVKYFNDIIKNGKFVPLGDNDLLNEILNLNRSVGIEETYSDIKSGQEKDVEEYLRTPTEVFARVMVYNYLYKTLAKNSFSKAIFRDLNTLIKPSLDSTAAFFNNVDMYRHRLVSNNKLDEILKKYFIPASTEMFFNSNYIEPLFSSKVDLMAVFGLTEQEADGYLKTVDEAKNKTVEELADLVIKQMQSKDNEVISKKYTDFVDDKIKKIKETKKYKFLELISESNPVLGKVGNFLGKIDSSDPVIQKYDIPKEFLTDTNGYLVSEIMDELGEDVDETSQEYYNKVDKYLRYVIDNGLAPFKEAYKEGRNFIKKEYGARSFASVFDGNNRSLTLNSSEIINKNSLDRISNMMLYELNLINDLMVKKYGVYAFEQNADLLDVINYKYSNSLIRDVVDSDYFLKLVTEGSVRAKQTLNDLYKYSDKDKAILAKYNELLSKKASAESIYNRTKNNSLKKVIDSLDQEINNIKPKALNIIEKQTGSNLIKDKKIKNKKEPLTRKLKELTKKQEDLDITISINQELKKDIDAETKDGKKELKRLDKSIEKATNEKVKIEEKIKDIEQQLSSLKLNAIVEGKLTKDVILNKYKQLSAYMFYSKSIMTNNRLTSFNELAREIIDNVDEYQKKESRQTVSMIIKILERLGFKDKNGDMLKYDPFFSEKTFDDIHNEYFSEGTRNKIFPLSHKRLGEIESVDALTTNELINIMTYIEDIRDIGKQYVSYKKQERKETVTKIRTLLIDGLNNLYDYKKAKTVVGGLFQKYIANSTKFSTMIKYITNDDPNHPLLKYSVYKEVALQGQYFKDLQGATSQLSEIYQGLLEDGESVASHFSKEIVMELGNEKVPVTLETLFMIALNMGNIENKDLMNKYVGRLVNLPKVSEKFVMIMLEKYLPENHMDAVQKIWDMFKEIGIRGFKEYERTHGYVPDGVRPVGFSFKGKNYNGGYFPILLTDTSLTAPATPFEFEEDGDVLRQKSLREIKFATSMSSLTHNKHMEERNRASSVMDLKNDPVIVELTMDRMAVALTNILKDFAWRRYLSDVNTVFLRNPDIKDLVTQKLGPQALYNIKRHIQAIAGVAYDKQDMLGEIATFIRKGATTSLLGFSIGTGLLQLGGVVPSINHIGVGNVMFGFSNFNNEYYVNLFRKSPLLMDRGKNLNRDIARTKLKLSLHDKVNEIAFAHIIYIDSLIARVTFIGAIKKYNETLYNNTLTKQENEAQAILYAEHIVNESQGSGLDFTLSSLESTNNPLQRLFTMFMTFSMSVMNSLMVSLRKNKLKSRLSPEAFRSIFYYGVVAPLVNNLVRLTWLSLAFSDDDEDKQKSIDRMVKEYGSTVLGTFPYFGNIGYSYLIGTPYVATPIEKLVTETGHLLKATNNVIKGDNPHMTFDRFVETMASVVSTTANVPVKRPAQMFSSLYNYWKEPDYYLIDFINKNTSNINKKIDR